MGVQVTRRDCIRYGLTGAALAGAGTVGVSAAQADETVAGHDDVVKAGYAVYATDVLIVGAGAAGTQAAISAANKGASVVIVDKKAFGHCGDSGMHYSGRMTSSDFGIDGDSPEEQLKDACEVGGYIVNQQFGLEVLQAYADDRVLLESENYGDVHIRDTETGKPYISYSRLKPRLWPGFKLSNMSYNALEAGVQVMDYCTVTKILQGDDGSAVGGVCLDFKTGELFAVLAKSVVLATGGDTGLWGAATIAPKYGGGAVNLTGDGHAFAAELGAECRDLEFRSLYNSFGPVGITAISNLCVLYSSDMSSYQDAEGTPLFDGIPDDEMSLRRTVVEYERAVMEGRVGPHGGVYADIDSYNASNGDGIPPMGEGGYVGDLWDQLKIHWEKNGVDFSHQEVAPQSTYDFGGIVTDIEAKTGVDGLFAAGECAMHCGAQYQVFRMFSSALVMGKRAGEAAAERALSIDAVPTFDRSQIEDEAMRVNGLLTAEPENPIRVHELRKRVQDSAWKGSGALRSDAKCNEALAELDQEEADLQSMYVADKSRICNVEWMEALEVANMIKMARMDTLASLTRTESRGTHLRAEYPEQDNDNWIQNVYVFERDGKLCVEVRPTDTSLIEPPTGKVDLGGGVLENY